ncbi:MAG: 4-hydroxybenzoate octaprenyltransferase [Sphingobacteriia bacterium 24-36-13]|uniref:UbiA-like polyprenyltransferase n=1 Tax=Sediminibacterium sp. TaxID=1917865 RepID=UPI000BCDFFA2|nr:UbiA-like polyprenyltransferase [Sediminibacterium sp.]OYY09768.1 MAG: 4-hydroxybenzoate octaprenyltransferase [Sphingobacteriia bacterium 35-36-14]OYZ54495.1 MAG: 4-hydroxybenzoate octaprenyltransferase [Sphingobacteriia bacterium 24-36-13]OZA65484.1 MAG: 4-hydroxybenzoate octaprenyltransferase [Sphingobacteriia bacterium 39-36-14]HQS23892.1 UbiA-like polyprenyltransferase [Sediminibacterium sp.]HQS34434.1 UbiA-like polyprenyltransferase [Sediminibacterium sp.]
MTTVSKYLSLVKFSHTIFAMPFAFIGFFLAIPYASVSGNNLLDVQGTMSNLLSPIILQKGLLVLVCMVTARNAAMAFNRYLDRHFDALNPRTAIREIPAGILSAESALRFVIGNSIVFILATWFINPLCFYLSFVALFVVLFYSFTKRFTALCHLVLGVGLSLAPIGAYLAVTGSFAVLPLLFSFAVIFWVSGFDIIYALQDVEFDQSHQLNSIPAALGKERALWVARSLHICSAACVTIAGIYGGFHWLYFMGYGVFVGMLINQHRLVKPNDLSKVNLAFMTSNGIASVVFAIFVIAALFVQYGW